MRKALLERKSKLAPTNLQIKDTYFIMGDKFVRNLVVTQLANQYCEGYLAQYVSDPNVKVYMKTVQSNQNLSVFMKREYNAKQSEWFKTADQTRKLALEKEMQELNIHIEENLANNDRTHNVFIVFSVFADTLEDLNSKAKDLALRLRALGMKTANLYAMQMDVYKMVTPLFLADDIPSEIKENITFPMSSKSLAGLYPFIFETLKDWKGFLLGREMTNGGVVLFDQFKYLNNPIQAAIDQRMNGNMIVVGKSGSGKTTTMNLMIRSYIRKGIKFVWIDPEDQNKKLCKRYGGTFIKWGTRDAMINIFDLKPVSSEDDENIDMYDTELAIYNVIDDVKIIFKYLYPSIKDDTLAMIGEVVIRSYNNKGITYETDFQYLKAEDMPTFSDFEKARLEIMEEYKKEGSARESECRCLSDLAIKMKSILNEHKIYFDGHTSIKYDDEQKSKNIIAFGSKILASKPKELRNALTHIMMQYAWSLCLNPNERTALVIDEAHTMILEPEQADRIAQFQRRSRKYKNVTLIGTQEPRDFADDRVLTSGKAIFNNAVYKAIMTLDLDAVNDLTKLVPLNDGEKELIQRFQRGICLLVAGSRRMCVQILATDSELSEMGNFEE